MFFFFPLAINIGWEIPSIIFQIHLGKFYHDRTLFSLTIDDGECKGNYPQMASIQLSEILQFTQIYKC